VDLILAEAVETMGGDLGVMSLLTILLTALLPILRTILLIIIMAEAVEGPQPMLEECFNLDTCPMGQDIPSLFKTS